MQRSSRHFGVELQQRHGEKAAPLSPSRDPHYWIVDPRDSTLTVMRWSSDGYITLLRAERSEVVRAEPFHAIEIAVGTLFGDDPA